MVQSRLGGLRVSLLMTRAPERSRKTIRALPRSSRNTLKACMTHKAAVMALVVAMAGMMLPAICLMSNFDLGSMPKMMERRLALAVTKSRVSSSSLSKVRTGGEEVVLSATEACDCFRRWLSLRMLSQKTEKFSASVHGRWS